jgi:hypothetical protein
MGVKEEFQAEEKLPKRKTCQIFNPKVKRRTAYLGTPEPA